MKSRHLAAILSLLASLAACANASGRHYEVTPEEFLQLANTQTGSVFDSEFIGATSLRAYLSVWQGLPSSMGGGSHVYSVELASLPAEIAERIRSGANPWPK